MSLERLTAKLKDPDQLEAALSGVKQFNKQPDFYNGYAKNFIMKTVKKGSDSDPRVGYIRQVSQGKILRKQMLGSLEQQSWYFLPTISSFFQASTLISSLESVLSGGDALMNEKSTSDEAVKRIRKAQGLIAKFIAESGVEDEKLATFVASHK